MHANAATRLYWIIMIGVLTTTTTAAAELHLAVHDALQGVPAQPVAEKTPAIRLAASPGEFEPGAFTVWSDQPAQLELTATALKGPGGATWPASCLRLQREDRMKVKIGPKGNKTEVVVPEWLLPLEGPVDLAAKTPATFWVTVRVLDDAAPGAYRGTLTLKAGETTQRIDLIVAVRAFKLERPSIDFAMMYTYEFRYLERWEANYEPAHKRRHAADLPGFLSRGDAVVRDMAQHGMTVIAPHSSRVLLRKDGKLQMPDLAMSLKVAREHGMQGAPGWFTGHLVNAQWADIPHFDEKRDTAYLKEFAAAAQAVAREHGYDHIVVIPADEPTMERKLAVAKKLLSATKGMAGVKFGVTGNYETFQKLKGLHQVSIFDGGTPDEWAEMKKEGNAVWLYDNHASCGHSTAWSRLVYGFLGWRAGFDAVTSWTYPLHIGDWGGRQRINAAGEKIPAYDGNGRPINTRVWEAIREGIDDRRYLDTLVHAIAAARKHGKTDEADKAQALIDELQKTVSPNLKDYGYIQTERGKPEPGKLDLVWMNTQRAKLAEAIAELHKALAAP